MIILNKTVTLGQPKVLDYLKGHDGASQKEIAAILSFVFTGRFNGVREGTILATFTMGKVIGMIGDKMDQHVRFVSFMTKKTA